MNRFWKKHYLFAAMEVSPKDDPENSLLRDKMQRIQMMLAQRKEQRRNRRETVAPYTSQRLLQKITSANISSLSASLSTAASTSVCMAARATASAAEGSEGNPHSESSSDPSSNYCKPNIEQDSLAVWRPSVCTESWDFVSTFNPKEGAIFVQQCPLQRQNCFCWNNCVLFVLPAQLLFIVTCRGPSKQA